MSPVTHFLTGWIIADLAAADKRSRALIALAGVAPDIDGLGIVPELITRTSSHPLLWFSLYHHSLHTLAFSLVFTAATVFIAKRSWKTAALVLLSFHVHLVEDLLGSRGPDRYQWPIPYLKPFSSALQLTWSRQSGLNTWPNFLIIIGLLSVTLWRAWQSGFSPLEMISSKADANFVTALRHRFPKTNES